MADECDGSDDGAAAGHRAAALLDWTLRLEAGDEAEVVHGTAGEGESERTRADHAQRAAMGTEHRQGATGTAAAAGCVIA